MGLIFDGHLVDFDEVMKRSRTYAEMERESAREFNCRLMQQAEK